MNARTTAAVGLRLIGFWLVLESVLSMSYSLFGPFGLFAPLPLGAHRRYYDAGASVDLNLHETYYVITHSTAFLVGIIPGFAVGCILLTFSKPLARLLAHNLQDV